MKKILVFLGLFILVFAMVYASKIIAKDGNMIVEGNLGIGTNNPGDELHVYDDGDTRVSIESSTGNIPDLHFKEAGSSLGSIGYDPNSYFKIRSSSNLVLQADSVGGSYGNVGIGTDSPSEELEVKGDVKIDGGNLIIDSGGIDASGSVCDSRGCGVSTITLAAGMQCSAGGGEWYRCAGGWLYDSYTYTYDDWMFHACIKSKSGDTVRIRLRDNTGHVLKEYSTGSKSGQCWNSPVTLVDGRRYFIEGMREGSNNYCRVLMAYLEDR